ncbi:MAG: hypothetical protein ABR524_04230, partial [Thermoanaerobaculia bacterium]
VASRSSCFARYLAGRTSAVSRRRAEVQNLALTQAGATAIVIIGDGSIGLPTERLGPGPAVFTVQNTGTLLHTLSVQGEGQDAVSAALDDALDAGEESSLQIDLVPGNYVAWCSLHQDEPGERAEFTIESP